MLEKYFSDIPIYGIFVLLVETMGAVAVYGFFNDLIKLPTTPYANISACPQLGDLTRFSVLGLV